MPVSPGAHGGSSPAVRSLEETGEADAGPREEIWVVETRGGEPRRRVGPPELTPLTGGDSTYSLHDLSWSPDGRRIAFTWYDRSGWARILISEPDGSLTPLPVPEMVDPWESGRTFLLSAAQFVWDPKGESGVMVAWDDECGRLFSIEVPAAHSTPEAASGAAVPAAAGRGAREGDKPEAGIDRHGGDEPASGAGSRVRDRLAPGTSSREGDGPAGLAPVLVPREIPLAGACRTVIVETEGFWLHRALDSDFRQRLTIVDRTGTVIDSRVFDAGPPVLARWGQGSAGGRPPVVVWRPDRERGGADVLVWTGGEPILWRRDAGVSGPHEPLLFTNDGLWLVEDPGGAGRLMLIRSPGADPIEVIPAGVAALRASRDGSVLVAAIRDPGVDGLGLWKLKGG